MTLNEFFSLVPKAAVAFSGGTDSAFLLWAARECGCDVRAYYVKTAFQPQFELEDAHRLASELEVPMTVVEADILAVPEAAANGPQRCYHCKTALFSQLRQAAREDGYTVLLDGTNASDDAGDRPGMRALRELEVRSPLRECGLPSFGQEWLDQISGDYSGQNIRDYLSAIDDVAKEPWVDKDRLG